MKDKIFNLFCGLLVILYVGYLVTDSSEGTTSFSTIFLYGVVAIVGFIGVMALVVAFEKTLDFFRRVNEHIKK